MGDFFLPEPEKVAIVNSFDSSTAQNIGQPLRRKEDQRLLTGAGQFSDDFSLPGQAHAAMVRSPYPHAIISNIDKSAALSLPGVLAVITGSDLHRYGIKAIPHSPVPSTKYDLKLTAPGGGKALIDDHYLLPIDRVRHVGEGVAIVIAENLQTALDGLELVKVEYQKLPHVTHSKSAIMPDAPTLYEGMKNNVLVDTTFGDKDATEAAFSQAAHVVEHEFHIQRVTGVTMEPRSALGDYDTETGQFSLIAGSGGAVRQRNELATVLAVDPSKLRVLSPDVGGNFGTRNRVYVEFGLVLFAARQLGRPVKFTATRTESFLTDYQGRDLVTRIALALDQEGKFVGLKCDNLSNVGSHCVSLSPLGKGSGLVTGSYQIPVATLRARAVFTNTMSTQAYRSSGRPEVTFAIERIIEIAARRLGFDPLELRRKNLVTPADMPYVNAVGSRYDSGEYEINMDHACRLADWKGYAKRKLQSARKGLLRGRGFANYVESSIGSPREQAEITVHPNGVVDLVIGTQPSGQGHETSFAQVASDLLGIPIDNINIILGDTAVVSIGGGTHSGRSMRHAGTVIGLACDDMIAESKQRLASFLECPIDNINFANGIFMIRSTNHQFSFAEIALNTMESQGKLKVVRQNEMHTPVYPNGTAICEVEIDPKTGVLNVLRYSSVDDVGRCINPLIVHGQTHGGIVQGAGQALFEHCFVDNPSGQPLAGSLMDYGISRAYDFPNFKNKISEVLSPTNPLGVKAGGEGGTTPALAVIVNAAVDALQNYGVEDIPMPLTPQAIWKAIQTAQYKPNQVV
jgi:carbon-monoxide dehydrogenase large subunit